jgi:hypothetical protein
LIVGKGGASLWAADGLSGGRSVKGSVRGLAGKVQDQARRCCGMMTKVKEVVMMMMNERKKRSGLSSIIAERERVPELPMLGLAVATGAAH